MVCGYEKALTGIATARDKAALGKNGLSKRVFCGLVSLALCPLGLWTSTAVAQPLTAADGDIVVSGMVAADLTFDSGSTLYLADGNRRLFKLPPGGALTSFTFGPLDADGLAVDTVTTASGSEEYLIAVGRAFAFTLDGNQQWSASCSGNYQDVDAADGIAYIGMLNATVCVLDVATGAALPTITGFGGFRTSAVAVHPDGDRLYVSLIDFAGGGSIVEVDLQSGAQTTVVASARVFGGMDFDGDGRLVFADRLTRAVRAVHPDAGLEETLVTGLITPQAVAFDGAGLLHVSDVSARAIYRFDTRAGIDCDPDIIVDNHGIDIPAEISFAGNWPVASSASEHFGLDGRYAHTGGAADSYRFTPDLRQAGNYRVMVWNNCFSPRAADVPHTIVYDGGSVTIGVDQDCATASHGEWLELGTYPFAAGSSGYVEISDAGLAPGQFIGVDGVRFQLEGVIVVDNGDEGTSSVGAWSSALGATEHFGSTSEFASVDDGLSTNSYRFTPAVDSTAFYQVAVWNSCFSPRETAVPHEVVHAGGSVTIPVNQDCASGTHGEWYVLGNFPFTPSTGGYVEISNQGLSGYDYIGADAVRLTPVAACR